MLTWRILDYNGKHRLVNLLGVMTWHYITDKRNTCYHREISFTDLRWCVLILCDVGSCAAVTSHQLNLYILCVFSAYSLLLISYFSRSLCPCTYQSSHTKQKHHQHITAAADIMSKIWFPSDLCVDYEMKACIYGSGLYDNIWLISTVTYGENSKHSNHFNKCEVDEL